MARSGSGHRCIPIGVAVTRLCFLLIVGGCMPVEKDAQVSELQTPVSAEELHTRLSAPLQPLWTALDSDVVLDRSEMEQTLQNFRSALALIKHEPNRKEALPKLLEELEQAIAAAKEQERGKLVWLAVSAYQALDPRRYQADYIYLPIWEPVGEPRPEVRYLERKDENTVLLEVISFDTAGQPEKKRVTVSLGEEFGTVLRLEEVEDSMIILQYLPLEQNFAVLAEKERTIP